LAPEEQVTIVFHGKPVIGVSVKSAKNVKVSVLLDPMLKTRIFTL